MTRQRSRTTATPPVRAAANTGRLGLPLIFLVVIVFVTQQHRTTTIPSAVKGFSLLSPPLAGRSHSAGGYFPSTAKRKRIPLKMMEDDDDDDEGLQQDSDDDDDDDENEPEPQPTIAGDQDGVMLDDLNWRVAKLRLEEQNTQRFLKSRPRFLPYEECRKWVQAFGRWKSEQEWRDWIAMGEKRNSYIPSRPDDYYGDQFVSWQHFLGTSTIGDDSGGDVSVSKKTTKEDVNNSNSNSTIGYSSEEEEEQQQQPRKE